jgi:hypothetical protein
MGNYLNTDEDLFVTALSSKIYVDKSNLIAYTNEVFNTEQRFVCVSRPRRFGKSMAARMLNAYYSRGADARELFASLSFSRHPSFETHLNKYNTLFLNIQEFLSATHDATEMIERIQKFTIKELLDVYPDINYSDKESLFLVLADIYRATENEFVFIIDEWDCIIRQNPSDHDGYEQYHNFLRLKDNAYVGLM